MIGSIWKIHEVDVCFHPGEALKLNNICPICRRTMTIGVLQRVKELADRPEGYIPLNLTSFIHLIPLTEILMYIENTSSPVVKSIWETCINLVQHFGNEYNIMLNASKEEISKIASPKVTETIIKVRLRQIRYKPGFDGVHGGIVFESEKYGQEEKYEI